MATAKKRKSSKRRTTKARAHNPINPTRRHKSTKRRTTKRRVYARRNPINPTHRRKRVGRRRHHRNPVTGVFGRAVPLVLGSAAISFAKQFVAPLVVRIAPQLVTTPIGAAGTTFLTGWGLSTLAGMFAFTRRWKDDILLAGAVLAGGQLFTAYALPVLQGAGMQGTRGRRGMNGIVAWPGVPPGIGAAPMAPPNAQPGMNGLVAYPGVPAGVPMR